MAQDNLQSQSEQEIQFKKRARRRLIGAVALVLLMIVLLPILLEDRVAQMPKEEVVISIPSQDNQLESKLDTKPANASQVTQLSDTQATGNASLATDNVANTASPTAEVKPVENSVAPAESKPSSATKVAPVSKKEDVNPQASESTSKMDDNSKAIITSSSGNYFVQIGVFSNPDKVKQLQAKLNESGLKSATELIDTPKGKKTRLRVGTFSSKGDADAALVKVKALGLSDAVVGN
jgi:DedD protein